MMFSSPNLLMSLWLRRDRDTVRRKRNSVDSQDEMELVELEDPPPINQCVGHWIIRKRDGDREGLVESVNRKSGMMIVVYEKDESDDADEIEVMYSEPGLVWLQEIKAAQSLGVNADAAEQAAAASKIQSIFRGR